MADLDDAHFLTQHDSQQALDRAAAWRTRLAAVRPALTPLEVAGDWLDACTPHTPQAANPAKQLAVQLFERVPLFWAAASTAAIAADWQVTVMHTAETAALSASLEAMARNWSMARFPRFWNNAVAAVLLTDGAESVEERSLIERVQSLLTRRRCPALVVGFPPGYAPHITRFHALVMGDLVALYLAALYQVDPAGRVAWQFLGLDSTGSS